MRKTWLLIGILMIAFTIYEITTSYAKYLSEAEGTAEKNAGAWAIKINNSDIVSGSVQHTFVIGRLTLLPNQYVADGYMAPASVGFFDITIDPSGSSVAIRIDVDIDSTDLGINDAINIDSAYKVVNGTEIANSMVKTTADTYTGIMTLSEVNNNDTVSIRIYVRWSETGENDEEDTEVGDQRDLNLDLPVNVTVSQYVGETITPYQ